MASELDDTLRAIIANNSGSITQPGWDGFGQMMEQLTSARQCKKLAAQRLLSLRECRRFHEQYRGKSYFSEIYFDDAQEFRRAAQGRA